MPSSKNHLERGGFCVILETMKSSLRSGLTLLAFASVLVLPGTALAVTATTTDGLIVTPVAKQTGPQFFANLSLGSSGPDVMRLQRYLNTHGCQIANTGPGSYQNETTYFGTRTKASVMCFQKDTGLITPTGTLGPLTRAY